MKTKYIDCWTVFIGFMYIAIGSLILIEIILNLCPPISRDALIHHLAIPKIWLNQKHLNPLPWSDFSWYPMNIQLIYAVCLWIGNDILPKLIHMFFGLGCSWLIYEFIKTRLDRKWALIGFLMFISLPIVIWLSTTAYVDLGMTFFTTASILYVIKFQWDSLSHIKNLIVSAVFMGLALGCKYNALIVFFLVNIAILYMVVTSEKKYYLSMAHALLFLIIACMIASPWYIRNWLHTGNPFYPMFNSVFQQLTEIPNHPLYCDQLVPETSMNAITLRKILYNESLWETLLIPVRMFFQGSDYQYRYFQGVLNPMIVIFIPFALIKPFRHQWMPFLLGFIGFYGYIAFFTTMHQVRYLLPVFPFLCILSVFGLHAFIQMVQSRNNIFFLAMRLMVVFIMICLFCLNIRYVCHRFGEIDPIQYLTGNESKDNYLKKHLSHYEAYQYINENLPPNSIVLTFFLGRRGYYLNCRYKHENYFGIHILQCMIKNADSQEKFNHYIDQLDITHILVRTNLLERHLSDRYSPEERQLLNNRINSRFKVIYFVNGYAIWQIR